MPIHSDISVPVLFFNMPVPVQRLWLTCWGNKNLVLGETERRGLLTRGFFHAGRGIFFQVGGMRKFLAVCPDSPGMENCG